MWRFLTRQDQDSLCSESIVNPRMKGTIWIRLLVRGQDSLHIRETPDRAGVASFDDSGPYESRPLRAAANSRSMNDLSGMPTVPPACTAVEVRCDNTPC
jgi:hypothetical protein